MKKTASNSLLGIFLLVSLGLLSCPMVGWGSTNQVIAWYNYSPDYTTPFGTNAQSIVLVWPGVPWLDAVDEDGLILQTPQNIYWSPPASSVNIVAITGSSWYLDEVYGIALRSDGKVVAWGQLPVTPPITWTNVVALGACMDGAIALRSDGTLVGWGNNLFGELNFPSSLTNVVAISAGARHNLALRADGSVIAWGDNTYGQTRVPAGLSNVVAIAAGYDHSLALKPDGTVVAWGNYATAYNSLYRGISNVAAINSGWGDVALRADGTIFALDGSGGYGPFPVSTPLIATNVLALSCGYGNIAVLGDGLPRTPVGPINLTVAYGLPLVLPSGPNGTRPLSCQWSFNGAEMPRKTNSILWLPTVDFTNAGIYRSVVSNWYGVVTNTFTVDVVPFRLLSPPQSRSVYGGVTVTFNVDVLGSSLGYQWQFDSADIASATTSTLTLTNVLPEQEGFYRVIVSNAVGAQTLYGELKVTGTLRFDTQPAAQIVLAGTTVSFATAVEGVGPVYYQWLLNGSDLPGQTNASLTLTNVSVGQSGNYSVIISNRYAAIQSTNALLQVLPLGIVEQPQSVVTFKGAFVSFNVVAGGEEPLSYQWQFEGTVLPGATGDRLVLTNVQLHQSGIYSVIVDNSFSNETGRAVLDVGLVANWNYPYDQMQNPPGLTNIMAVATGGFHNIAVRNDGTVIVWGLDTLNGELDVPPSATNVISVAAGGDKNLVLRADGTVLAWGDNTYGENTIPENATNVVAIAQGDVMSFALRADGTLVGWGATTVPPEATNIVAMAGGYIHSLALTDRGTVIGWGGDNYGQATVPAGLSNIAAIAAGGYDSLALRSDGSIINWGESMGALNTPPDGTQTAAIGIGFGNGYALKADGQLQGLGSVGGIPTGLQDVTSVAVGYSQVLALIGDHGPVMQVMATPAASSGNGFAVSIPSQSGHVYRLESTPSLPAENWTALPLVAGTGRMIILTDHSTNNAPHRFYRVRRW